MAIPGTLHRVSTKAVRQSSGLKQTEQVASLQHSFKSDCGVENAAGSNGDVTSKDNPLLPPKVFEIGLDGVNRAPAWLTSVCSET